MFFYISMQNLWATLAEVIPDEEDISVQDSESTYNGYTKVNEINQL